MPIIYECLVKLEIHERRLNVTYVHISTALVLFIFLTTNDDKIDVRYAAERRFPNTSKEFHIQQDCIKFVAERSLLIYEFADVLHFVAFFATHSAKRLDLHVLANLSRSYPEAMREKLIIIDDHKRPHLSLTHSRQLLCMRHTENSSTRCTKGQYETTPPLSRVPSRRQD